MGEVARSGAIRRPVWRAATDGLLPLSFVGVYGPECGWHSDRRPNRI